MGILIHSKSLAITKGLRNFIASQVKKLDKFKQQRIENVQVFIDSVKTRRGKMVEAVRVKVRVALPGKDIIVNSKAHDLYLAISQALKDAQRAVRKRKEKRQSN